ncbi:unnamed protein product [Clonostachys chloroleuca]|uniref:Uncharacterized protein n=1 Tax=Clonostachys chloroleuca TaxID=1926264 RepID=A0AA35M5T0_9HYPO|nr:unnamed protein product [Clonostachys chloroleuca]
MNAPLVYIGFWINHTEAGSLAFFVLKFSGYFFLTLVASNLEYLVYYRSCPPRPRAARNHQQRARPSYPATAAFAVLRLFRLIWTWLGNIWRPLQFVAPKLGLVLVAIFSSWLIQQGGDVLLADNGPKTEVVASSWSRHVLAQGQEYARRCYTPFFFPCCTKPCNVDTPTLLRSLADGAVPCPFSEDICAQTPAFEIGTWEYINSNEHLGIKPAKDGQLHFRSVTKCVPILAEEKHSTPWFKLPHDLIVPHADITVLYLLNIAVYSNVTKDPWFQATNKDDPNGFQPDFPDFPLGVFYFADRVASTLGCTRQWEFYTMDGSCTSPMGLMEILHNGEGWRERLNPKQAAVLELLSKILVLDFSAIVSALGAGILSANDRQVYQFSEALRPTQWHREIMSLHSIGLASMQRFLADFPSVPVLPIAGAEGNKTSHDFIAEPEGELRSLCGSIRVLSDKHTNLNVFWLVLLLMVGLSTFGIRYLFLPLQNVWFHGNFRVRDYPNQQWKEIAVLYDTEAGALRSKNPATEAG